MQSIKYHFPWHRGLETTGANGASGGSAAALQVALTAGRQGSLYHYAAAVLGLADLAVCKIN